MALPCSMFLISWISFDNYLCFEFSKRGAKSESILLCGNTFLFLFVSNIVLLPVAIVFGYLYESIWKNISDGNMKIRLTAQFVKGQPSRHKKHRWCILMKKVVKQSLTLSLTVSHCRLFSRLRSANTFLTEFPHLHNKRHQAYAPLNNIFTFWFLKIKEAVPSLVPNDVFPS